MGEEALQKGLVDEVGSMVQVLATRLKTVISCKGLLVSDSSHMP